LKVLVTGATGRQGGAVTRLLIKKNHDVRALTRNPNAPQARALRELGVEIVEGDFENLQSIKSAVSGLDAMFLMSTPFGTSPDVETKQGIIAVNAIKDTGIKHLVFTSVGSAHLNTGIPHFDSKYKIEEHIIKMGIPSTIIRPVFFMENFLSNFMIRDNKILMGIPNTRKMQMIPVQDIAGFAVLTLENREKFLGKHVDIASDEKSGREMASILTKASGKTIDFQSVPVESLKARSEDMALMYEWFGKIGYSVDILNLKKNYPEVKWHSFENWAENQDWSFMN
jgi:uncharacterized protein YbjT (DUF2867 family)